MPVPKNIQYKGRLYVQAAEPAAQPPPPPQAEKPESPASEVLKDVVDLTDIEGVLNGLAGAAAHIKSTSGTYRKALGQLGDVFKLLKHHGQDDLASAVRSVIDKISDMASGAMRPDSEVGLVMKALEKIHNDIQSQLPSQ